MTLDEFGRQVPTAERLAATEPANRHAAFVALDTAAATVVGADRAIAQRWVRILKAQVEDLGRWAGTRYLW